MALLPEKTRSWLDKLRLRAPRQRHLRLCDNDGNEQWLPRRYVTNMAALRAEKVEFVAACTGTGSLRDFGGLWRVHGRYLLEPAKRLNADFISMIDISPTPEFDAAVADARANHPGLEVEFISHDFTDPDLYHRLRPVDTSILYEVLLHQENYIDVMKWVASRTERTICIAQPCLREDLFPFPASASLLQFWPQELKNKVRFHGAWPEEPVVRHFESRYWMWGQTTSHLVSVMQGLGWRLDFGEVLVGPHHGHWEFPMLRFRRA